jgi:epoxide hydrolase
METRKAPMPATRRQLLKATAVLGAAAASLGIETTRAAAEPALGPASVTLLPTTGEITPFNLHVPEGALSDLRRRLRSTRWPERETVTDNTQGAQLERVKKLVAFWASNYDWRRVERRLNGFGQFRTRVDDLGIHFLHVRSRHKNALPLLITHGWPSSVLEFADVIGPLTDPTAYGGQASDAFHVVAPSVPGFGFSDKPTSTGWGIQRIASAWTVLMNRLGYTRYVVQGGDIGAALGSHLASTAPAGLMGVHLTFRVELTPPVVTDPTPEEQQALRSLQQYKTDGYGYFLEQSTRPQTVGYGLHDSPTGQAAWLYEKYGAWTDSGGNPERVLGYTKMLDDITLYWLSGTAASSARIYWEATHGGFGLTGPYRVPVGYTAFPGDIFPISRRWAEATYGDKLVYFNRASRGGHFAALEQPAIFINEVRTWARLLR